MPLLITTKSGKQWWQITILKIISIKLKISS